MLEGVGQVDVLLTFKCKPVQRKQIQQIKDHIMNRVNCHAFSSFLICGIVMECFIGAMVDFAQLNINSLTKQEEYRTFGEGFKGLTQVAL